MPSAAVLRVAVRELTTRERSARQPEPDLVMADPLQVADYVRAGLEDGVLAPVYLYHCANICEVIKPGDRVLDLACGPANQLAMVARLNPDVDFVGADLSETMLERAKALVQEQGLNNISLRHVDITDLSEFGDSSFDAVVSTMALHHLPTAQMLDRAYSEAARVLKADGGVYMVDFGHLKSDRSIDYFANQYKERQPPIFTVDYLNSLRAAFSVDDFKRAARSFDGHVKVRSTFLFPFMVATKSHSRRKSDADSIAQKLDILRRRLPAWHQVDLADLCTFFRLGGLSCRHLR